MSAEGLRAARAKMRERGVPEPAIAAFARAYERLEAGEHGMLSESELEPLGGDGVARLDDLPDPGPAGGEALDRVAVVKLNGGLATGMGLTRPKSLLEAREGRTFLELIVGQVLGLRARTGARLPLLLMNSFATRKETLRALERYPRLGGDLPADFLQGVEPKLDAETLHPVRWPRAPELEWCPPGHGDVFTALGVSGVLDELLDRGYEYAFVSNSDNLGATLEPRIAAWAAAQRIPFVLEVVEGTRADRKGGHIARRRRDGQLVLREVAQTPLEEAESFRDYRRWRHYSTNTLWIRLRSVAAALKRTGGGLDLPTIVNRKTVDPRDPSTPEVIQLESAMGAAIATFAGARALQVPRTRFIPVKTTDDLLLLRSDAYETTPQSFVAPVAQGDRALPFVELDRRFYALFEDFEARFPHGVPSLVHAERLLVRGDVSFGARVVVRGAVELDNADRPPAQIEADTELEG